VERFYPPAASRNRVDIEAALTCGTDLKVFKRGYRQDTFRPRGLGTSLRV
jgi:hypothetical protein